MSESETTEAPKKKISRRDFLKGMSAAAGAYALYRLGLKELGSPEGKPSQRVKQFAEITKLIKEEPRNQEYQDLMIAWLKFNVAGEIGRAKKYGLAVATIDHFLDGHGETLKVTDEFRQSVERFNRRRNETTDHAIARATGETISRKLRQLETEGQPLPSSLESLKLAATRPGSSQEIEFSLVTPDRSINDDIYYSLNRFTLGIKGRAIAEMADPQARVMIQEPEVTIYDEYNWIKGSPSETGIYLGQEIDSFLYRTFKSQEPSKLLKQVLGEKRHDRLYETRGVTITDAEGELLTRHGFGTSFEVEGKLGLNEPISFQISPSQLE